MQGVDRGGWPAFHATGASACGPEFQVPWPRRAMQAARSTNGETIMSKSQDSKKAVKKEPAKNPKEKKEAKKLKKEASKRQ
jgi:hypothetical protein